MLYVCSLSFCRSQSTTCAGFSFSKLGTPKERFCRPSHPLFVSNKNTHQRMPQLFTWLLISSVINRIIWLRLLRPAESYFCRSQRTICRYIRKQDAQVSPIEQSDPMLTASRVKSWHQIAVLSTALLLQHEQARPPGNLFSSRGCISLPCCTHKVFAISRRFIAK